MKRYFLSATDLHELAVAIAAHLRQGAVGIVPTETVYGLVCRHGDRDAEDRIRRIKGRPDDKPFQVLLADPSGLAALEVVPSRSLDRLCTFWPGPLTVVARTAGGASVGVRIPDHDFVRALIRLLDAPLTATSANPSGVDPGVSLARGFTDLAEEPDFLVLGGCGQGRPSTVVRLDGTRVSLVRSGAIEATAIRAALHAPPSRPPAAGDATA